MRESRDSTQTMAMDDDKQKFAAGHIFWMNRFLMGNMQFCKTDPSLFQLLKAKDKADEDVEEEEEETLPEAVIHEA